MNEDQDQSIEQKVNVPLQQIVDSDSQSNTQMQKQVNITEPAISTGITNIYNGGNAISDSDITQTPNNKKKKDINNDGKQIQNNFHTINSDKSTTITCNLEAELSQTKNQSFLSQSSLNNNNELNKNHIEWINGLLAIQDQEKIIEYIEQYQPYQKSFDMRKLQQDSKLRIIKYKNGIYYGQMEDENKENKGLMIYFNGRIYEGEWKNNQRHGKCVEIYPDGSKYEGYMVGGKKQGKGQFKWANGEIYDGEWNNGFKHGSGMWKGSKGDSYIGEWKQGKADGFGVHTWINGDRYEGEFRECLKHGLGTERFQNGEIYIGNYYLGKPEGYGEYYWANGNIYKGFFSNGLRHGRGFWQSTKDSTGNRNGSGNGDGEGSGGDMYKGYYRNDKKCGQGEYFWANGNVYRGNFQNDLKHGQGELYYSDGSVQRGTWVNGTLIQQIMDNNEANYVVADGGGKQQDQEQQQQIKDQTILLKNLKTSQTTQHKQQQIRSKKRLPLIQYQCSPKAQQNGSCCKCNCSHGQGFAFPIIQRVQQQPTHNKGNGQEHYNNSNSKQNIIAEPLYTAQQPTSINQGEQLFYKPRRQLSTANEVITDFSIHQLYSVSPNQRENNYVKSCSNNRLIRKQQQQNRSLKPIWRPPGIQSAISRNSQDKESSFYME